MERSRLSDRRPLLIKERPSDVTAPRPVKPGSAVLLASNNTLNISHAVLGFELSVRTAIYSNKFYHYNFARTKRRPRMRESIAIKNFGPINEIDIDDIRPFTLFIGESGSGKSTVMKVLVLFRWIYKMVCIRSYLKQAKISQSPFKFDFKEYLNNNGLLGYLHADSEIIYQKGSVKIHYRAKLSTSPEVPENEIGLEKMCFISDKRNLIPDILAGRKTDMSFFLNETFGDFKKSEEYIKELDIGYLGVNYLSEKTNAGIKYYILDTDKKYKIKLEDASSGTQTLVPLAVIIEYFSRFYDFGKRFNTIIFDYMSKTDSLKDFRATQNIGDIEHKNIHIHIEEPELSLYPDAQRDLIDFIVNRCFIQKHNGYDMTVMMATHSPYIINHLNLLILADKKGKQENNASLAIENVAVFEIIDGYLNDLKQSEKPIIDTRPLSETISAIYDR
jgi:predicted ATPase